MINENLLTFADVLSEELEVDTRTPEMINEAQENLRQTIDAHFTSTPKITSKQLYELTRKGNTSKTLVTTDGEWAVKFSRSHSQSTFRFEYTKNFYKSGTSPSYTYYGKPEVIEQTIVNAFKDSNDNIDEAFKLLEKLKGEMGDYAHGGFDAYKRDTSNKDEAKMNPYVMVKNVKPYAKGLPTEEEAKNAKLRKDDVVKMVINGQIGSIVVGYKYTDDYAYDAATNGSKGNVLDPIDFLEQYIRSSKPYVYWQSKNGNVIINCIFYSNYSVTLLPNPKKFK